MIDLSTGKPMTRRDVLRGGIASIIAAKSAPYVALGAATLAGPANAGMPRGLGARLATNFGGKLTAKDYVQNGLVAMWDGIENNGYGDHSDSITYWKDLTGRGADFQLGSAFSVGSDHVKILSAVSWLGQGHPRNVTWTNGEDVTLESVFDISGCEVKNNMRICSLGVGLYGGNVHIGLSFDSSLHFPNQHNKYPSIQVGDVSKTHSASWSFNNPVACYDGMIGTYGKGTSGEYIYNAPIISTYAGTPAINAKIKSMRLYSRVLEDGERLANYAIDKARFNLP